MAGVPPSPEMHPEWRSWAQALLSYLGFATLETKLNAFASTSLPSAPRAKYQVIMISNVSPQKPAYSDGTNWRYFDGTVV